MENKKLDINWNINFVILANKIVQIFPAIFYKKSMKNKVLSNKLKKQNFLALK